MKFKEILQERLNQIEKGLQIPHESSTYYYKLEIRKQKFKILIWWYCLTVCLILVPFGGFSIWVTIIGFLHLIPLYFLSKDKKLFYGRYY